MWIQGQSILGERMGAVKKRLGPAGEFIVTNSILRPAPWRSKDARAMRPLAGGSSAQPVSSIVTSLPIRRHPARVARLIRQRADQAAETTRDGPPFGVCCLAPRASHP
jgi:hypothetical protein